MLDVKINTFLKTVEFKSYTKAAEALHLTQPAVTQHIRKLEAYYGCQLIDSAHRSVHITEAGMVLYEYLSLQLANEMRFSRLLHNVVEPLRVGATLSIGDYYLPKPLVTQMLTEKERIRVEVGNTAHLLDSLRSGKIDCAFIEGLFDTTLFETHVFCKADFLPVVHSGHPLLHKKVSLEELHEYPLVLREPHSGTREIFENWLYHQNDIPQSFDQLIELGSFILIKEFVRRSQAVTFVYKDVVKEELHSQEFCVLDLNDFQVTHELRFVYRKGDARHRLIEHFYQNLMLS